jgi:hypothetical protein
VHQQAQLDLGVLGMGVVLTLGGREALRKLLPHPVTMATWTPAKALSLQRNAHLLWKFCGTVPWSHCPLGGAWDQSVRHRTAAGILGLKWRQPELDGTIVPESDGRGLNCGHFINCGHSPLFFLFAVLGLNSGPSP